MRKPVVVVCGVAAAVLLAGGIAATTAGAETAPDVPSLPGLSVPDMPAVPQLPADAGQPDAAGGLDVPGLDDQHDPAQDRPDQVQPAQDRPAQDRPAQGQAGQADGGPGQNGTGQDGQNGNRPAQAGDDTPHRPGGPATTDRDDQQRTVRKSTLAAAQREVSPASVSVSPSAPVQQQVLSLVNENRRRGGCGELTLDRRLIDAAYGHAADMARRGYFAHESPNGEGAGDRVQDAGYKWSRYGENIARGQESPYEVVDGWMHSPEHRENIMDCQLHQMGIGLAFGSGEEPYWVQDFATPW
jgi:uncharacterized protein YkwD